MKLKNAIGIDPDSKGFYCYLVRIGDSKSESMSFLATADGLQKFILWVRKQDDVIVGIEGCNGQSKPIEKILRKEGIVFYSFKPSDVAKFRKVVLGQNKNNKRDAESVARFAMALESQCKLASYKRVWFPDEELQYLTRSYAQKTKACTSEINRLWKLIRIASVDLYLALGGMNNDVGISENIIQSKGILNLFVNKPDIHEWRNMSEIDLVMNMGGEKYSVRNSIAQDLLKLSRTFSPIRDALILMIKNTAMHISILLDQKREIENMLRKVTRDNGAVKSLIEIRGISTLTACKLIAEIINIRRFLRDDSLACYSGLGMKQHGTGDYDKDVPYSFFNARLKDAFMMAAKNFVKYNPDSHLTGYHRNLLKGGMKKIEARKRVARGLVRMIFKRLYALPFVNNES